MLNETECELGIHRIDLKIKLCVLAPVLTFN